MHMRRREFVLRGCEVAGSVAASLFCGRGIRAAFPGKPLLVIGVEAGVIAGYHVTIFNRGMTYPELFPSQVLPDNTENWPRRTRS